MSSTDTSQTVRKVEPVLDYESGVGKRRWHVGTLSYTSAGLVILFSWLLWGDFVLQLKEKSVPPALQLLFKQFNASDFLNGVLIGALPHLIAIVLLPIISYRSDRHRGRFGRRIPYLLITTPLAVLSMAGLAFSPAIGRWTSALVSESRLSANQATLINLGVFWAMFEFCSIICNSVFTALINDVVPRQLLGRFFGLFRIFGLAASISFSYFLFGKVEANFLPIFLSIGALYGIGFGAMCFFVKEGEYPPPEEEAHVAGAKPHGLVAAMVTYFRECFSHPYYIWFFLGMSLINMAFQPILLFYIYMAKSLNMTADQLGKQVSTRQLFCSFLLAFPTGWLCDKVHSIRVAIAATAGYALATGIAFFFIKDATSFTIAQIICGSIAGIWSTASVPLTQAIFPKLQFASFSSALGMCTSAVVIVAGFASGAMLDLIHHQYRYIYLWASGFSVLSLISMLVVYKKFNTFGGTRGYVAPLPSAD